MKSIDAVRSFLTTEYQKIHFDFRDLPDGYSQSMPGWLWIDEELSPIGNQSEHGLLMDPDVGVALFLVRFEASANNGRGTDIRAQVARAVGYRSRLLPQRVPKASADPDGSWRVVLYWLLDQPDAQDWQQQVSKLRRDTAHLEEIPVDAVVRRAEEDWTEAIGRHGLPRLLLRARRVLNMSSKEQVFQWSSADARVRNALGDFTSWFSADLERRLAQGLQARLSQGNASPGEKVSRAPDEPTLLQTFFVRDFRNLENIELQLAGEAVQTAVIHGPNGTGKSNLFEALEYALRGTSTRAEEFFGDTDVGSTKKAHEYLERYLSPIGRSGSEPRIGVNGSYVSLSAEQILKPELKGNLLLQDQVDHFVRMKSQDLAAEILGEFSGLADNLRVYAEDELAQTQNNLRAMLGRLGLERPGAVTKQRTARTKVAELELRGALSLPANLVALLSSEVWAWSPTTKHVSAINAALQLNQERLEQVAQAVSKETSDTEIASRIRSFMVPLWQARAAADQFLAMASQLRSEWPSELGTRVDVWGRWLEAAQVVGTSIDNEDITDKQLQRKKLADELGILSREGNLHRERERHFESLQSFLHGAWKESGNEHCPTCDTDFLHHGGILKAIDVVRTTNTEVLEKLRKKYIDVQQQMLALDKDLQVLDQSRCPLSTEEQEAVRRALSAHLPVSGNLEEILARPDERIRCLTWIKLVLGAPVSPQFVRGTEEEHVDVLSKRLQSTFRDLEMAFLLPDAWRVVASKLKEQLAHILEQHLPETLSGLWRELVMNLTPAPWQMLGDLDMHVQSRRGKQEARLVLGAEDESRLARYVLNRAETHALGLAWFLVRYLCHGRFHHAVLALDDPALDMDQTSFRDLCRLFESLVRLHKTRSLPLALLIFLHQDERALNAARATGGLLYRLGWNSGRASLARSIKLFSEEYRHPRPTVLLKLQPSDGATA